MELDDEKAPDQKRSRPLLQTGLASPSPKPPRNDSPLSPFFKGRGASRSRPASTWRELVCDGDQPPPMSGLTATYYDRTMYVFGGYARDSALDGLFALDLDHMVWSEIAPVGRSPSARTSHSAAIDPVNHKLYICCGSGSTFGHTNMDDFYEFDLVFRVWRQLEFTGDKLESRYGQTCVYYDQKLFVFGGTFGRDFSKELFVLDLVSQRCRKIIGDSSTPVARYKHAAGLFDRNKMLLFGGAERQNYKLNDVAYLNLDTLRWTALECSGERPGGRFAHSMCIHGDKAFVFGGTDRESCQSDLYILDIAARTWTKLMNPGGAIPRGRYFHGSVFDPVRNDLLIWGGKGSNDAQIRFGDLHAIRLDVAATADADQVGNCTLRDDLSNLLSAETLADLDVVANDATVFQAHQLIVRTRCPGLTDMIAFDTGLLDDLPHPRLHLDYTGEVVERLLWYLYSDDIALADDAHLCLQLMLCGDALGLPRLAALCERRLRRGLTVDQAEQYLAMIGDESAKATIGFAKFLAVFIAVQRGECDCLDEDRMRPFMQVSLPPSTLHSEMGRLQHLTVAQAEAESLPFDIRFQCGKERERLGAHQVMLAARSKYFGSFSFLEGMREAKTRICTFPSGGDGVLSKAAFVALLHYIYGGEAAVMPHLTADVAQELLDIDVCNFFGLSSQHLQKVLRRYLGFNDGTALRREPTEPLSIAKKLNQCTVS